MQHSPAAVKYRSGGCGRLVGLAAMKSRSGECGRLVGLAAMKARSDGCGRLVGLVRGRPVELELQQGGQVLARLYAHS